MAKLKKEDVLDIELTQFGKYQLSKGKFKPANYTVSDDEILSAQKELSSVCGLFSEPAAATAYAGFLKQKSSLDSGETCVVLLTGNGLKDTNSAAKNIILPEKTINSLDEIS